MISEILFLLGSAWFDPQRDPEYRTLIVTTWLGCAIIVFYFH